MRTTPDTPRARPAAPLPPELAELRAVLVAEREHTAERIAALTRNVKDIVDAASFTSTDDEHDPEGATIAFERSQASALLDSSRSHLADIDEALARLADGEYGRCERCGMPIAPARLAARPAARTCIACASGGEARAAR